MTSFTSSSGVEAPDEIPTEFTLLNHLLSRSLQDSIR